MKLLEKLSKLKHDRKLPLKKYSNLRVCSSCFELKSSGEWVSEEFTGISYYTFVCSDCLKKRKEERAA